jgi:hypothetical protein
MTTSLRGIKLNPTCPSFDRCPILRAASKTANHYAIVHPRRNRTRGGQLTARLCGIMKRLI